LRSAVPSTLSILPPTPWLLRKDSVQTRLARGSKPHWHNGNGWGQAGKQAKRRKSEYNGTPIKNLNLDLDGALDGLSLLVLSSNGLGTHDTTAPVATALFVLAGIAIVDGGDKFAELGLVLALDLGECDNGGGLLVHDGAQARLALDDSIGDAHLAAQSGQENHQLDRVHIVGDQHQ
jgi:hypothetical protein